MKLYKLCLLIAIVSIFTSCREDDPTLTSPKDTENISDWNGVFESFWNTMNNSYSFWEIDPTDWDNVYIDYKPKFKDLKFGNHNDSIQAVKLFTDMTANLIDHHYTLVLKGEGGSSIYISPALNDITSRSYFHKGYSIKDLVKTIETNINKGRISHFEYADIEDEDEYGNKNKFFITSYLIDNNIAYLWLNTFDITGHIGISEVQKVINNYYSLVNDTKDLKGVIIDTRNNGGGNSNDLSILLGKLISKPYTLGYVHYKNGMGRLDYYPWKKMVLSPEKASYTLNRIETVPLVGLVDINSISMSEITPITIRQMPNGYIVGERTWGGHGGLDGAFDLTYSGKVENDYFMIYTSTVVFKHMDGKIYEGKGITPDLEVLFDKEKFGQGIDTQLDRAVQCINDRAKK